MSHSLQPGDIARLDQIGEEAKADLDGLIIDPDVREAIDEDGPTIAAARLSLSLHESFSHMGCAGLAAFAILRLIQAGEQ